MGCGGSKGDDAAFDVAYESGNPLARKLRNVFEKERDDAWYKEASSYLDKSLECSVLHPCDPEEASALAYHFCAYIDRRHKEKSESGSASVRKAEPGCIEVEIRTKAALGSSSLFLSLTVTYTILEPQKRIEDEARYKKILDQLECNHDYFLARADAKVEESSEEIPIYKNCASLKEYLNSGLRVLANNLFKEVYRSDDDDLGYAADNTVTKSQGQRKESSGSEQTALLLGGEAKARQKETDSPTIGSGAHPQEPVPAHTIIQAEKDLVAFRAYAETIWESGSTPNDSFEAGKKWKDLLDKPQISWVIQYDDKEGSRCRVFTTIQLAGSRPRYFGYVVLNLRGAFTILDEAYEEQVSDYENFVKALQ